MKKSELMVHCIYSEQGETAAQIIFHAFAFFLQRELGEAEKAPSGLIPGF